MSNQPRTADGKRYKRISEYTSEELKTSIDYAAARIPDFYIVLNGIDAYMEQRRRKLELETSAKHPEQV